MSLSWYKSVTPCLNNTSNPIVRFYRVGYDTGLPLSLLSVSPKLSSGVTLWLWLWLRLGGGGGWCCTGLLILFLQFLNHTFYLSLILVPVICQTCNVSVRPVFNSHVLYSLQCIIKIAVRLGLNVLIFSDNLNRHYSVVWWLLYYGILHHIMCPVCVLPCTLRIVCFKSMYL